MDGRMDMGEIGYDRLGVLFLLTLQDKTRQDQHRREPDKANKSGPEAGQTNQPAEQPIPIPRLSGRGGTSLRTKLAR